MGMLLEKMGNLEGTAEEIMWAALRIRLELIKEWIELNHLIRELWGSEEIVKDWKELNGIVTELWDKKMGEE